MKLAALVAVPPGVTTETVPLVAPAGTVAAMCVASLTLKDAAVPLKRTALAPVRLVPVRVTAVPTGPEVGLKPVSVGAAGAVTVKLGGAGRGAAGGDHGDGAAGGAGRDGGGDVRGVADAEGRGGAVEAHGAGAGEVGAGER